MLRKAVKTSAFMSFGFLLNWVFGNSMFTLKYSPPKTIPGMTDSLPLPGMLVNGKV